MRLRALLAFFMIFFIPCGLNATERTDISFLIGDIEHKQVKTYSAVKHTLSEILIKNPSANILIVSDYDNTIKLETGSSLRDEEGFRETLTHTDKCPTVHRIIATARWHHSTPTISRFEQEYEEMLKEMGSSFSNQDVFGDLKFNLMEDVKHLVNILKKEIPELENLRSDKLERGIFIKGTCFTGTIKPLVVLALLLHEKFPIQNLDNVIFIDDSEEMTMGFMLGLTALKKIPQPEKKMKMINWHLLHFQ